jgi:hypothetical protein
MKSVYLLGISVAIGAVIVYLLWQQKKKLEEMNSLIASIQVPQQSILDREFIIEENKRLHKKIEDSYDHVHQQYEQVLIAVDNIPVIGSNNYYSGDDEESENIRSYHGEALIDIVEDENMEYDLSNVSNEHNSYPKESILAVENQSISSKIDNSKNEIIEEPVEDLKNNKEISIQSSMTSNGIYPKISELKNLCRERNLTVSGNKNDLVQRLLNSGYIF